jgi:hypothetical protein
MQIYKFQNGTKDFNVGVLYSTHGEEMRLQSNDEPRSELYLQASSLVFMASSLFGLQGLRPSLKEISFSSGQDGAATRLLLTVPLADGSFGKLALPKIPRRDVVDSKTKEPIADHPRNLYNTAADLFEKLVVDYVQGRRLQAVLDFNAEQIRTEGEPVENDDEDFDVEETGRAAS